MSSTVVTRGVSVVMCRALLVAVALASLLVASGIRGAFATDDVVLLPTPLRGHAAVPLESGTVLLVGGFDGVAESALVGVVDPGAGTVASLGALMEARADHTATRLEDGRVLVAGGRAGGSVLRSAELLDPSTGVSVGAGPMRAARADHLATSLADGRVLLLGGVDEAGFVATAELFDPVAGTFVDAATPLTLHPDGAAVALADGRVLVTGDAVAVEEPAEDDAKKSRPKKATKSKERPNKKSKQAKKADTAPRPSFAQVYDPQADQWSPVAGGDPRRGHAAVVLEDGRVLLTGGLAGEAEHGQARLIDPAGGTFVELAALAEPRSGHTATLLADGRVAIIGGSDVGFEVAPIEVFDPNTGTFLANGGLDVPRDGHSATLLPDGRILVVGGDFVSLVLDDVLLYDASDGSVSPLQATTDREGGDDLGADAPRTRADVRAAHGAPDAFVILYDREPGVDGTQAEVSAERWSYNADGIEYVFAGDEVVAAASVAPPLGVEVEPLPYDPGMFTPDMDLDAVVAVVGAVDYTADPVAEMVEGLQLFFTDRLAWGLAHDRLRYVQAFAFGPEDQPSEAPR